ncbi:linalool dehydratase/isomerase domain-containing protein [Gordonia sp. NPDC003424]
MPPDSLSSTGLWPASVRSHRVDEATEDELATLRFLLDLALQPLNRWDGFTRLEQIGGSALRYQIAYVSYALSVAQYTRTPAFGGYLAEGQANMIRKMCDKRVWGYWATERLTGYLRWNPDPVVFANVMYSGFFATMLAFYETLNADNTFDDDGSLPLVWNRRTRFEYGFSSIATAIADNMRASRHTLYPCEPHLIYPMCNTIAVTGLVGYDRLHGTDLAGDFVAKIATSFRRNGYLLPNGRFRFGLGPAGLKLPPTLSNDAVMAYWLNGVMPELAADTWDSLRHRRVTVRDGRLELLSAPVDRLDVGSYRKGDAWTLANIACAARELGDDEAARAAEATIGDRFRRDYSSSGARRLAGASTWANGAYALATFLRKNDLRGLALGDVPEEWRTGPMLTHAAYPDVLVAKAVTDGSGLDLALYPGAGPVRTKLGVSRLAPGTRYLLTGCDFAEVVADETGHARLGVCLSGRHEVTLRRPGQG